MRKLNTLGGRLRYKREGLRWSTQRLAEEAGCSPNTISLIELGRSQASRKLPDLAKALGTTVDWLAYGDRQPVQSSDNHLSCSAALARIGELVDAGRLNAKQLMSIALMAETMADSGHCV